MGKLGKTIIGLKQMPKNAEEWVKGSEERKKKEVERKVARGGIKAGGLLAKALKLRYVDHLSINDIVLVTGVADKTLRQWMEPFAVLMENPEEIKEFKKYEADILDGVRFLMTKGMVEKLSDPVMRKKMDLSRLTYGFGVLFDKARLERGESTANVMTLSDLVKAAHAKPVLEEAKLIEQADAVVEAAIEATIPVVEGPTEVVNAGGEFLVDESGTRVKAAEGDYGW